MDTAICPQQYLPSGPTDIVIKCLCDTTYSKCDCIMHYFNILMIFLLCPKRSLKRFQVHNDRFGAERSLALKSNDSEVTAALIFPF